MAERLHDRGDLGGREFAGAFERACEVFGFCGALSGDAERTPRATAAHADVGAGGVDAKGRRLEDGGCLRAGVALFLAGDLSFNHVTGYAAGDEDRLAVGCVRQPIGTIYHALDG